MRIDHLDAGAADAAAAGDAAGNRSSASKASSQMNARRPDRRDRAIALPHLRATNSRPRPDRISLSGGRTRAAPRRPLAAPHLIATAVDPAPRPHAAVFAAALTATGSSATR